MSSLVFGVGYDGHFGGLRIRTLGVKLAKMERTDRQDSIVQPGYTKHDRCPKRFFAGVEKGTEGRKTPGRFLLKYWQFVYPNFHLALAG